MTKAVFAILALFLCSNLFSIHIVKTTCELAEKPLALHTLSPRLGWELASSVKGDLQTAYEIIVASSLEKVNANTGDVWSTEKVLSGNSQFITYGGHALKCGRRYYWKVRVWDAKRKLSDWSQVSHFDMGLLSEADWGAQWIGAVRRVDANLPEGRNFHKYGMPKAQRAIWDSVAPLAKASIQLRKEFGIDRKTVQRAMVYVSGLGQYELLLNGRKVGESEFAPLWTDYDKTVYYNAYDVTNNLRSGPNAIGVLLGNGMYNVTGNRYIKFWGSFGPPTLKLRLAIEYSDGSQSVVVSDPSWRYALSPITFNCIFGGEDYNATLEQNGWNTAGFNDANWTACTDMEGPQGALVGQLAPPVFISARYNVKSVLHATPGRILLDMGQNLSGYPEIRVRGQKGQKIKLWVAELTKGDTLISQSQSGSPHYYEYTLKGGGDENWRPRFSYYGFQYIQVEGANYKGCPQQEGLPQLLDIKSCFLQSSATRFGTFGSSNELFNKVHTLINNAIRSNMQAVFTDCPHREKLGWLEQTHLVGPGIIYNYDVANLLGKTQYDMMDAQLPNGLVPSIAPEFTVFEGGFRDSPEWGGSLIINPWMLYVFYGDDAYIAQSYDAGKGYFNYLATKADNGILSHGLGDWYDYGEHRAGPSKNTPIALSATAYFYHMAHLMALSAARLGHNADQQYFEQWKATIGNAFNQKFYNTQTHQYGTGSQVSNAMALYFGLVAPENKEAVLANLVADIKARGNRLTSGDVGNLYLFRTLANNGFNQLMYSMNNHYEVPGYGFQIQFGVTTLTENWDPRKGASWNHFMMGQIEEWFFRNLAGIAPDKDAPGFKHFYMQPAFVDGMEWVSASTKTPYGHIVVRWKNINGSKTVSVEVPVNTTATLVFENGDASRAMLNGVPLLKIQGAVIKQEGSTLLVDVGSGSYLLKLSD